MPGPVAGPDTGPPRWLRITLIVAPAAFVALFYGWPVATLIGRVIDGATVADTLGRPGIARVLWFTTWQAVVSTLATLVVGIGPAYLIARWNFRGRRLVVALVTVPFLMPTVVIGAAFTTLLPTAMRHTAAAVVVAHVFFNIAVVVRVVGTLWARLPRDLVGAARVLGASPWRAACEVTLPLLRPALIAAGSITMLFTFTSFGVVQILGGPANPTLEVEIARRATQLGDIGGAATLSMLQLVMLGTLLAITMRGQHRSNTGLALDLSGPRSATTSRQRWAVGTAAAVTAAFIVAPLVALVLSSVRPGGAWSLDAWTTIGDSTTRPGTGLGVDALAAIGASCRAAALATLIAVSIGGLAALAIAAARRGGRLVDFATSLPLGTSAVTIGFGMLITFDQAPFDWRGQPWLIAVGHALVAVPFVVRATLPVLVNRPPEWIDAAATLGAGPVRSWWEIDVRLIARPLVVGAGFAAAISFGEFGATTLLSRSGNETLPLAIGRLLARTGDLPRAHASVLAVILAAVTLTLLVAVDSIGGNDARRL